MSVANSLPAWLRQSETKLLMLLFSAPWSGSGELLLMALEQIKQSNNNFVIVEINEEENKDLSIKMGIMQIPTVILLRNHEIVDRFSGAVSRKQLLSKINRYS